MRHSAAKLAFVHRTSWQRNAAYRWAVLLGPPPLIGCALAVAGLLAWRQVPHATTVPGSDAAWAHWTRPVAHDTQPYTEAPAAAVPKTDAAGNYAGFQTGWVGDTRPMTVDATMDANVIGTTLTPLSIDEPAISLSRIVDAGPASGLFVGAGKTFFVVQKAGLYAFSAQLTWSGMETVTCLVRLGSAHHGMIRNINLNVGGLAVLDYAPTTFRLEPGLILLQAATGCWRGDHVESPGTLTVLVRRPGETVLTPVTAKEVIRPVQRSVVRPGALGLFGGGRK